jgi:nucleoside-diphosphate-sugar epimerase
MGGYKEADLGPGELTTALPPDPGTWFHTPAGPQRYLAYAASKLMGERIVAAGAVASGGLMTGVSLRIGWCQGGRPIFDGAKVHARVIVVLIGKSVAKCQCKAWVELPLAYTG